MGRDAPEYTARARLPDRQARSAIARGLHTCVVRRSAAACATSRRSSSGDGDLRAGDGAPGGRTRAAVSLARDLRGEVGAALEHPDRANAENARSPHRLGGPRQAPPSGPTRDQAAVISGGDDEHGLRDLAYAVGQRSERTRHARGRARRYPGGARDGRRERGLRPDPLSGQCPRQHEARRRGCRPAPLDRSARHLTGRAPARRCAMIARRRASVLEAERPPPSPPKYPRGLRRLARRSVGPPLAMCSWLRDPAHLGHLARSVERRRALGSSHAAGAARRSDRIRSLRPDARHRAAERAVRRARLRVRRRMALRRPRAAQCHRRRRRRRLARARRRARAPGRHTLAPVGGERRRRRVRRARLAHDERQPRRPPRRRRRHRRGARVRQERHDRRPPPRVGRGAARRRRRPARDARRRRRARALGRRDRDGDRPPGGERLARRRREGPHRHRARRRRAARTRGHGGGTPRGELVRRPRDRAQRAPHVPGGGRERLPRRARAGAGDRDAAHRHGRGPPRRRGPHRPRDAAHRRPRPGEAVELAPIPAGAVAPAQRYRYTVALNEARMAEWASALAARLDRPGVNARYTVGAVGALAVKPGVAGIRVDQEQLKALLLEQLPTAASGTRGIAAPIAPDTTAFTTEQAKEWLPKLAKTSTFTTQFPVSASRHANIATGSSQFDGVVIMPGQTFSFWQLLGPVTVERGYAYAGAIIENRSDENVIGGGLCQVSTTIFNAVAALGYEIVERHEHGYLIERYPIGLDAAVFEPGLDLRWRNDTGSPVFLWSWVGDTFVTFDVWGLPTGRTVTFSAPSQWSFVDVPKTQPADPAFPKGYAISGRDVARTRTVTQNGAVLYTDTFYSHYAPVWGGPAEEPKPAPAR